MKAFYSILLTLALLATARASEVVRNTTLTDGQQIYASDLHNLIDTATIGQSFYNDQLTVPGLGSGFYVLALDPATQLYRRLTAQNFLYNNTNIFLYPTKAQTIPSWALVTFFDLTNVAGGVRTITLSNFMFSASSNIQPANISFAATNGSSLTVFALPNWTQPFGGSLTNNQPYSLWWSTNGVPYQQTLTNLEKAIAGDLGTNYGLPFTFSQIFTPWLTYGTNANFTNNWGSTTNFPIATLNLTNQGGTNWPTLMDTDSVPVFANAQKTNTTATLLALYQYMTNKNALPPYTTARVQFGGFPVSLVISNVTSTANGQIMVMTNAAASYTTNFFATNSIYAVSFITNASPLWSGMTTNQVYYIVPCPTNSLNGIWCNVFSNYSSATLFLANASPTNCIQITGSGFGGAANTMLYLTNFTGFNADAVQVTSVAYPATVRTAYYDIWFRTPAASSLYYLTGSCQQTAGGAPGLVSTALDGITTTNRVRVVTTYGYGNTLTYGQFSPTEILIQPQ